eukprot:11947774-Heterocapsa_arctica.AAC.1
MSAQRDAKHAVRAGEGTNVGELRVLVQDGHRGPRRHVAATRGRQDLRARGALVSDQLGAAG